MKQKEPFPTANHVRAKEFRIVFCPVFPISQLEIFVVANSAKLNQEVANICLGSFIKNCASVCPLLRGMKRSSILRNIRTFSGSLLLALAFLLLMIYLFFCLDNHYLLWLGNESNHGRFGISSPKYLSEI